MGTRISDSEMISDSTGHTATAWPVPDEPTLWTVTWLPGRNLTRDQAITAMTIAEVVAAHERKTGGGADPIWLHVGSWAAELGLSGADAAAMASLPPQDHAAPAATPAAGFGALLTALLRERYAVSFQAEPDGVMVHLTGDDDTLSTHIATSDTPALALEQAAAAAGACAGVDLGGDDETETRAQMREDTRFLIHAVADLASALRTSERQREAWVKVVADCKEAHREP